MWLSGDLSSESNLCCCFLSCDSSSSLRGEWSQLRHVLPCRVSMLPECSQGTSVSPLSSQVTLLQRICVPLPVHHTGRPWTCVSAKHSRVAGWNLFISLGVEKTNLSFCYLYPEMPSPVGPVTLPSRKT